MSHLKSDENCREFKKQDPGMWVALTTLLPGEAQGRVTMWSLLDMHAITAAWQDVCQDSDRLSVL